MPHHMAAAVWIASRRIRISIVQFGDLRLRVMLVAGELPHDERGIKVR